MRQVKQRLFATALSLAVLFSLFPETSFATASVTETTIESTQNTDILSTDTKETPDEAQSVMEEVTPEDGGTPDEAQSLTDEVTPEDGGTPDEAQSVMDEVVPEDGGMPNKAQSVTDEVTPEDGETSDETQSAANNAQEADTLPVAVLQSDAVYQDGTYTGSGKGYKEGLITVEVTVTDGKITSVVSPSHEGQTFWSSMKLDSLLTTIVDANSPDVDGVSGATLSSNGVKEAVRDALSKAAVESPFASGTGTARNPYVIETAGQLAAFAASVDDGTTYEGQYVTLGADIELSGDWNPIGDEGSYTSDQSKLFNGSFDGQGHTVSGMSVNISRDDEINAGLFSTLNTAARVSNINLKNVSVTLLSTADGKRVRGGGITGATVSDTRNRTAVIDSCSVEGAVSVTTSNAMGYAAGIAGQLNGGGAILNCVSQVDAAGSGTGTAGRPYVGGITANNGNGSVIANCVSDGVLVSNGQEADGYAGGLGGMLTGTVENCCFMGGVTLKGSATANAGSLVGMILTDSAMLYYPSDGGLTIGGESVSEQPFGNNMGGASAVGMTQTEMETAAFAETLNGNLYRTYKAMDDKNLTLRQWEYVDGKVTPSGEIWVNETVDETIFTGGEGTQTAPWTIETAEQLRTFALSLSDGVDYDGAFIQLGADIDLSGETWTPIGEGEYAFEGTFDGAGHSVTGLTVGTAETPLNLSDNPYIGLFGVLGSAARVKNVALGDMEINVTSDTTVYVGGVAGLIYRTSDAEDFSGAVIDGVSVTGSMTAVQQDGNCFVGGIVGYQQRGAVINSWTDVAISDTTLGGAIAEGGGLVGLLNRGLVANCYALGDIYVSGNREDGKEGMGAPGGLISVNGGSLAGSYSKGNLTSKEISFYAGTVAGWVTGIGKAYNCFYNGESVVTVNGSAVNPVPATGTVVPGGVSEDGLSYNGGVTDKLEPYTASGYAVIAETLNGYFASYPVDLAAFGLASDALKTWTVTDGVVTLSDTASSVIYVQPEAEIVPDTPLAMRDGVWYGRDENKSGVVKITVTDGAVSAVETVSGTLSGDAYDAALETAKEKSAYGDFTHYEPADPSKFAGGSGAESDPYLISNVEQLRYLSSSVNEDVSWKGVWFRQTADIDLSGADFIPIGWAKEINVNNSWENVGYFFEGSYDGGGYVISGLTIGSESAPADYMVAGLFGLTNGEYETNDEPTAEQNAVTLRNINLRDVAVYISCGDQTYAGGLVGMGQNGILIDDCSVTGIVHASTTDSHCRAGGLAASLLRGRVTDSWTDVDVSGVTEKGRVYASGLCVTNRVSVLNCYTLGNTSGKADQYNRVWVGGIDAFAGGLKINCYSFGDVIAESGATGVGGVNGLVGGISETYLSYFNADAVQSSAGTKAGTNVSTGDNFANATDESESKTAAEMKSAGFVTLLNENRAGLLTKLNEVKADLGYPTYFSGFVSDFQEWTISDGHTPVLTPASDTGNGVYVLMNIPYADFYAAELGPDDMTADTVTSATPKAYNPGITAGSYHDGETSTEILGITYPVCAESASVLTAYRKINSEDALFSGGSYAYVPMSGVPENYKVLTLDESGKASFGAVQSGASKETLSAELNLSVLTRRGDYEITYRDEDAVKAIANSVVLGEILTTSDGHKYPMRHLENIWENIELALCTGHSDTIKNVNKADALTPSQSGYAGLEGSTVTGITYYVKNAAGEYQTFEVGVNLPIPAYPIASFTDSQTIQLTGLPQADLETVRTVTKENPENTGTTKERFYAAYVTNQETEHPQPLVLTENPISMEVSGDGAVIIRTEDAVESGVTYAVRVIQDRTKRAIPDQLLLINVNAVWNAPGGSDPEEKPDTPTHHSGGCYVATAVYGSYDCPEVWTLRRFRDNVLAETWYGRLFIRLYYAVSPTAVKLFGDTEFFQDFFRARLDTLVSELQEDGFESTPYEDAVW